VATEELGLDSGAFGISALEARSMDPQQAFVLHVGYAALVCGKLERDPAGTETRRARLM
jgi:hypothetical protein